MPRITNIELIQQLEQPILSVKLKVGMEDLSKYIGQSFMEVAIYLKELDQLMTDIPVSIFHDYQAMDSKNIDLELAFPVAKKFPGKDTIQTSVIPESKLAFCMYQGTQYEISDVYLEMEQWITDKGLEVIGPSYEYYYNNEIFGEDKLLTKIAIPVK